MANALINNAISLQYDMVVGDLLYNFKTKPDLDTGQSTITNEVMCEVRAIPTYGDPVVHFYTGKEYFDRANEMQLIKVGNTIFDDRAICTISDNITEYAPRHILCEGVNHPDKFMHYSTFVDVRGKLGDIYDEDFGGWLTVDGLEGSKSLVGNYTKNIFGKGRLVFVGDSYFKGNVIIAEGGVVKNVYAGVGGDGVIWTEEGLKGFSDVLGMVFYLPTDGSKPTYSSGIINETIFEISTNAILRTSQNVGSGDAGALINNTGYYYCSAGQTLANADVVITETLKRFTGNVYVTGGNVIVTGEAANDINSHPSTVSGTKITPNSIDTDKLNCTTLSAITSNLGTVTAGDITGVYIHGTAIEVSAGYGLSFIRDSGGTPVTVGSLTGFYYTYSYIDPNDSVQTEVRSVIASGAPLVASEFHGAHRLAGAEGAPYNCIVSISAFGFLQKSGITTTTLNEYGTTLSDHESRILTLEGAVEGLLGQ